jgi:hypothetical protein
MLQSRDHVRKDTSGGKAAERLELRLRLQDQTPLAAEAAIHPYAFTEHGVAMLSSVLHSERAVQMNILIVRAFMKLRASVAGQTALARRIEKVESTQKDHGAILSVVVKDIETLGQAASHPKSHS